MTIKFLIILRVEFFLLEFLITVADCVYSLEKILMRMKFRQVLINLVVLTCRKIVTCVSFLSIFLCEL